MTQIRDVHNPWRDKFQQAMFRGAIFYVDTDSRVGGRRVALHQYPKRNIPYAEDMGRSAVTVSVQGYLIGPIYLQLKDNLISALEQDGPGMLRLPMPYQMADIQVMVQQYSISESREKGGFCTVEMSFVEYGDPVYRPVQYGPGQVANSAQNLNSSVIGPPAPDTASQVQPYASAAANVTTDTTVTSLP
jgi:hypothetical protein